MRRQRRVVGTRERRTNYRLASHYPRPHASGEFVGKGDAAAMGTTSDQGGKLPAAVELPRLFPGITDSDQALALARTIAGWKTCQ
jgi:hypothetical protein